MVPNNEKLIEVFIGGLPQSIDGTVTASKPQTLEEAINIAQRLLNQVLKHGSVQRTNDHVRKFDDRRNTTNNVNNNYPNNRDNNNYPNNRNNNNYQNNHNNNNNHYHQQHNRRQETFGAYAATPTENRGTMSSSNYLIIVLSDFDVDDAFSSTHFPNYFSASPENTSPDPSNDLTKDLLASLAISLFHDDPYMKVMHAYNATSNESPIPLPRALIAPSTDLPSSPVLPLSPMFDPQDFFLPKEILPPREQAHFYHFPILTKLQEARAQIFGLKRKKMRRNDKIALARFRISTQELIIEDIRVRRQSNMKSLFGYNP
nr:hypothetical protein [Tanacetum cinerariifolium]